MQGRIKKERKMNSKSEWVDFEKTKGKVSMEDILDHYGLLKDLKRKGDNLVGVCRIHDQSHYNKNSFCVNTSKNIFYYLTCGAGGNILDFMAAMENVNIREAGLLIQKWFGIASEKNRQLAKEKEKAAKEKKEAKPVC